jgi:hypothetical protein
MKSSAPSLPSPPARQGGGLVAQDFANLVGSPDEELALFAFADGILGAVEPSGRVGHFADNVVQDFFGNGAEEVIAGDLLVLLPYLGNHPDSSLISPEMDSDCSPFCPSPQPPMVALVSDSG